MIEKTLFVESSNFYKIKLDMQNIGWVLASDQIVEYERHMKVISDHYINDYKETCIHKMVFTLSDGNSQIAKETDEYLSIQEEEFKEPVSIKFCYIIIFASIVMFLESSMYLLTFLYEQLGEGNGPMTGAYIYLCYVITFKHIEYVACIIVLYVFLGFAVSSSIGGLITGLILYKKRKKKRIEINKFNDQLADKKRRN